MLKSEDVGERDVDFGEQQNPEIGLFKNDVAEQNREKVLRLGPDS